MFEGPVLFVAQEGHAEAYRAQLAHLLASGTLTMGPKPAEATLLRRWNGMDRAALL